MITGFCGLEQKRTLAVVDFLQNSNRSFVIRYELGIDWDQPSLLSQFEERFFWGIEWRRRHSW
jgi:hypothetical protein